MGRRSCGSTVDDGSCRGFEAAGGRVESEPVEHCYSVLHGSRDSLTLQWQLRCRARAMEAPVTTARGWTPPPQICCHIHACFGRIDLRQNEASLLGHPLSHVGKCAAGHGLLVVLWYAWYLACFENLIQSPLLDVRLDLRQRLRLGPHLRGSWRVRQDSPSPRRGSAPPPPGRPCSRQARRFLLEPGDQQQGGALLHLDVRRERLPGRPPSPSAGAAARPSPAVPAASGSSHARRKRHTSPRLRRRRDVQPHHHEDRHARRRGWAASAARRGVGPSRSARPPRSRRPAARRPG